MNSPSSYGAAAAVRRSWLVPVAGLAIGATAALAPLSHTLGWTVLLVSAGFLGLAVGRGRSIGSLLLLAFALRAGLALVHVYLFPLPDSGADAIRFEAVAWDLSQLGFGGFLQQFDSGWRLYVWLMGAMYRVTDRSPLMLQAANVFFGSLVVYNVFLIARAMWNERAARRAALVAAVFPTLALYSAVVLREVPVVYTASLGAYCFVRWRQSGRVRWLIPTLAAFFLSTVFHTGGVALLAGVALLLVRDAVGVAGSAGWFRGTRAIVGLLALGLVTGGMLASGWGLDKIQDMVVQGFTTELLMEFQQSRADSRAAYLTGLVLDSPVDLLWQTPLRAFYFLFTPFAWMVRSVGDVVAFFDALLYLGMTWYILRFRRTILQTRAGRGMLLLAVLMTAVLALGTSNYGTALRHRTKAAPLFIALAVGASTISRERSNPSSGPATVASPAGGAE